MSTSNTPEEINQEYKELLSEHNVKELGFQPFLEKALEYLKLGADVNARNTNMQTLTTLLQSRIRLDEEVRTKALEEVLKFKPNILGSDFMGSNFTNLFKTSNDDAILPTFVKLFIEQKGKIMMGSDLLNRYVTHHHQHIGLLVDIGCNVNMPSRIGFKTPLESAVMAGNVEAVKKLLELGANPGIKNREGHTIVDILTKQPEKNQKILEVLQSHVFNDKLGNLTRKSNPTPTP